MKAVTAAMAGAPGARGGDADFRHRAVRVETTVDIDCAADAVFRYVSTPALWPT